MQTPQRKLQDINRLLSAFPPGNWSDPEQAMRSYLLAVDDYAAPDVEVAVDALIKGVAPGVNPNFVPAPAAVGAECHRQCHLRANREDLERRLRPALPAPDVVKSPESQQRVRDFLKQLGIKQDDEQAEGRERHRAQIAKGNAYFDPPRGFSIGDPEGHEDAA